MIWIAQSEKDTDNADLEKRLLDAVDQFLAISSLKSPEYSAPVLSIIVLRFADVGFTAQRARLEKAGASSRRGCRVDESPAYHTEDILYLPAEARFDYLLNRPKAENTEGRLRHGQLRLRRPLVRTRTPPPTHRKPRLGFHMFPHRL